MTGDILLVSHFHWDREWYRTFEEFRARLVDAIDAVLDLLEHDAGFRFVLDGQAIVLEDYLEVRPHRRADLAAGIRAGRLAAGPWYVQPDSLLPGGESHVRNLLIGRTVASAFGPVSQVAYVPDSFGHPAQFPQLFAGFGLDPFVYWRGNGTELDELGPLYFWRAPDGTAVRAWHLGEGYFGAAGLDADDDPDATAKRLTRVVERLAASDGTPVLLMNGFDHLPPDTQTREVASALERHVDARVERVLLDTAAARLPEPRGAREWKGALVGARTANLLPGVWSARMPLKLRNRSIETLLGAWAEPWAAFGAALGLTDERPSLAHAWRALLCNQAHDSICGCSIDPVHDRMTARYDDAEGLARGTTQRILEHLAGRAGPRDVPWSEAQDVVVFNASPIPRTGMVRVPLDGAPPWRVSVSRFDIHPLAMPAQRGATIDGAPARVVDSDDPTRVTFLPGTPARDVEFVARDVPAFGARRFLLEPARPTPDDVDGGREIAAGDVRVRVGDDGALTVSLGGREHRGLFAVDDVGDRGDSYDCDPVGSREPVTRSVVVRRSRHVSGIQRLQVTRILALPAGLDDDTEVDETLELEATVAPGVPWVAVHVRLHNRARDHRLRLRFPSGAPTAAFTVATTFDTDERDLAAVDDARWVHPAPRTFPHQGWIAVNGLVVGAPGLPEAEVTAGGEILVTLVRSVGALSRFEMGSRPLPAGPEMAAPGAQVLETFDARIVIAADARDARAAEVGLWGVFGGPAPRVSHGASLLRLDAHHCELSACKPAEDGDGIIVRVLNPTRIDEDATLHFGIDVLGAAPVRLDETPVAQAITVDGRSLRLTVPAHALRSVRVHVTAPESPAPPSAARYTARR